MLSKVRSHVGRQWAGFLALFLVIAGGGAFAAFNPIGSDGDVDACFDRRSGDLDIQKGKKCGRGEKPVAWNVEGPRGAEGPQGLAGTDGAQGPQGLQGPAGSTAANVIMGGSDGSLSLFSVLAPFGESTALTGGGIAPRDMYSGTTAVRARDLRVFLSNAPSGGDSWHFELHSGQNNAELGCDIPSGGFVCTSGSQEITIPAGGQVYFAANPTGGPTPATVDFAWRALPG